MKALYILSGKLKGQDGGAMIMALMIMAILSIIGISVTNTAVTELQITSNVQVHNMALYDADSGIQFALAHLQNELKNGSTPLPVNFNTPVAFTGTTPSGFSFEISSIGLQYDPADENSPEDDKILNNRYFLASTGYAENAYGQSEAAVEATFMQLESQAFQFAGFGDKYMGVNNKGITKSYNSGSTDPTINDPKAVGFVGTGEADVGSNELLDLKNGAIIGGSAVIGKLEDGSTGTIDAHGGVTYYPSPGKPDQDYLPERVDPDPLGINSGGIYDPTTYKFSNDNGAIGTVLDVPNGATLTLTAAPGGANYYFTSVNVHGELKVDVPEHCSNCSINIFIDGGKLEFKNGSNVNFEGSALNFAIYSNYVSTDNSWAVVLKNSSDFTGTIYAPNANIDLGNTGDVYGSIWGKTADINNSGVLSYDEALKDKYFMLRDDLRLLSWAEERLL